MVLVLMSLVGTPVPASCSGSFEATAAAADVVFQARVTNREGVPPDEEGKEGDRSGTRYTVEVLHVYSGDVPEKTVVWSASGPQGGGLIVISSAAANLRVGERVVVATDTLESYLTCGNHRPVRTDDPIPWLGEPIWSRSTARS